MLYFKNYNFESEYYDYDFDVGTSDIEYYQSKKEYSYRRKGLNIFEFGIDSYRFDQININTRNKEITIFEFKSGKQDFKTDNKWQNYLKYCNKFIFVCPKGVILESDLPKGIGLYYVFKWKGIGRDEYRKGNLGGQRISISRKKEIDKQIYYDVLEQMVMKFKYRKEQIF